jgi:hypothetical protein
MSIPFDVTLCEYASANADGTYSIQRGGITFWKTESLPIGIRLYAFAQLPPGSLSTGDQSFDLEVRDDARITARGGGILRASDPAKTTYFALPIETHVETFGTLTIVIRIAGALEGRVNLEITPTDLR